MAGSDGAGKTAFYHGHLEPAGLRFVDADVLARELGLSPCDAARVAAVLRRELVRQRESFVYETVFLDPVGEKIAFQREALESGYTVVLCFVGIADARVSVRAPRVLHRKLAAPSTSQVFRVPPRGPPPRSRGAGGGS